MKNISLFEKKSSSRSKGFSLVEMMVAMFVFSLVMVGVVASFAQVVKLNHTSKRIQQNLEDVRFVFNRITKTLRTSVVVSSSGIQDSIQIYDYSQSKCFFYSFAQGVFRETSKSKPVAEANEKTWCRDYNFGVGSAVAGSSDTTLNGSFFVLPSSATQAGRITMRATITRLGISSTIQTTASLRNFEEYL